MENSTFTKQINVNTEGKLTEYIPAISNGMVCENPVCDKHEGKDYKRKPKDIEPGWEDEPIFLCDEHAEGYEQIK